MTVASMPDVTYKAISRFVGYRFGDDGTIWSCRPLNGRGPLKTTWRLVNFGELRGYKRAALYTDGKQGCQFVHRLILEAFVGPCPEGMVGCHNDGNQANNTLGNLRWDTQKSNIADAFRHGGRGLGEDSSFVKLTEVEVREIRRLYAAGAKQKPLGRKFGVNASTISFIVKGLTWKHVL